MPQMRWRMVLPLRDLEQARLVDLMIEGRLVLLVWEEGRVHALSGLCPHNHARLSAGKLEGGILTCPRHLAGFRLADGRCTGGWDLPPLARYPVHVIDGIIALPDPLAPARPLDAAMADRLHPYDVLGGPSAGPSGEEAAHERDGRDGGSGDPRRADD